MSAASAAGAASQMMSGAKKSNSLRPEPHPHMPTPQSDIRNFSIIAHIDHGKSTLADRILEVTGALTAARDARPVPRQDGHRARARDHHQGADRPPQVHGEGRRRPTSSTSSTRRATSTSTTRSRAASRRARARVLVVDSTQGVEAQTLANVYLAIDQGLEILPVLNKVDLPVAPTSRGRRRRSSRSSASTAPRPSRRAARPASACREILEQIVAQGARRRRAKPDAPLRALIFDTWYDSYRGAVVMVRVVDGTLKKGDKIRFLADRTRLRGHRDGRLPALRRRRSTSSAPARSASSPRTSRASTTRRSATR